MRYRIFKKTYANGSSWYYIQEKVLFFWIYLIKDLFGFYGLQRLCFNNLESAEEHIKMLLKQENNNKVIKTEILK